MSVSFVVAWTRAPLAAARFGGAGIEGVERGRAAAIGVTVLSVAGIGVRNPMRSAGFVVG